MKLIFYSIFFITAISLDLGVKSAVLLNNDIESIEILLEMQSEKEGEEKEESKTEYTYSSKFGVSGYYLNEFDLQFYLSHSIDFMRQHFAEIPVPPPDYLT